jgi:FKBP-type peptidyl-prolyl cis-trans isomerase
MMLGYRNPISKKILWWVSLIGMFVLLITLRDVVQHSLQRQRWQEAWRREIAISRARAQVAERQIQMGASDYAGLQWSDEVVGTGRMVLTGDRVTVHYKGTLADGTKIDSSYDRKEPFTFTMGKHEVIPGWEKGILGMRVGGQRTLTISPLLAYGESGVPGSVPPNATLKFVVKVLKVEADSLSKAMPK